MASPGDPPPTDGLGPTTRALLDRFLAARDHRSVPRDLLIRIDRNYIQPLESCLARAGLPPADREDVLSQIRLSLAQGRLRTYDPARGQFRAWLFHSVARDFLGRWRRAVERERRVDIPGGIIAASPLDGPEASEAWEASCIAHAVLDAVVRLLDELARRGGRRSERVIDILTAVWVEGKDPTEAGRRTGILRPAVRYHLRRARKRLIAILLQEISDRDLCGGPFEAHLRILAGRAEAGEVDGLVRNAARYLLDKERSTVGTTAAIRSRIFLGPHGSALPDV